MYYTNSPFRTMTISQQTIALRHIAAELHHCGFPMGEARKMFLREAKQLLQEYCQDEENYAALDDLDQHVAIENHHQMIASFPQPPSSTTRSEPWQEGPPSFTYYTEVPLGKDNLNSLCGDTDPETINSLVSQIIGYKGHWLKKITQETGVHYIYYNPNPTGNRRFIEDRLVFQIWGPQDRLVYAEKLLSAQIKHVLYKMGY